MVPANRGRRRPFGFQPAVIDIVGQQPVGHLGPFEEELAESPCIEFAEQLRHQFPVLAEKVGLTDQDDPVGCQPVEDLVGDRLHIKGHAVALDDRLQLLRGDLGPRRTGGGDECKGHDDGRELGYSFQL